MEFGCIRIHDFIEADADILEISSHKKINSHKKIEKYETDLFGEDNFEIKILDEVFLCRNCQNEISLEDSKVKILILSNLII